MKKLILNTLVVACGLALSPGAFAAKTGTTTITKVSIGSTGNVFVTTAAGAAQINPAGCTFNSSYMIDSTDPILKTYMAILLTARAAALPVNISISDDTCVNSGKYPKIANVEIQ